MTAIATRPCHDDNDDVVLVPLSTERMEGALQLLQEMSWPYRLEDWAISLELGQGFVLRNGAGTVIATAAWWAYGDEHASAGMIIVAKAAQGRGNGARLMDALLAAAHPRTITLNSTAEGLALYERRGFARIGVIQQHQGVPDERHQAPPASHVRAMAPSDVEAVARLDRQATGRARRQMLDRLIEAGDGLVLVRDGEPRGYVISRLFGRGRVIGPVVAETVADARALIDAALARLGRVFVRVDTAATSQLGDWLASIGLCQVGDATTMVKGCTSRQRGQHACSRWPTSRSTRRHRHAALEGRMTSFLSEFPHRSGIDMAHDRFVVEAYGATPPQGHYSDTVAVRRKGGTS